MAERVVVIENPIINGPFVQPTRHFRFNNDGITDEIVEARRRSQYFLPIPPPRRRGGAQPELALEESWTSDRIKESVFTNQVRGRVDRWRKDRWPFVTGVTRRLLEYWTDPERERPLFFCQVEALETAIYLTEAAARPVGTDRVGDPSVDPRSGTLVQVPKLAGLDAAAVEVLVDVGPAGETRPAR